MVKIVTSHNSSATAQSSVLSRFGPHLDSRYILESLLAPSDPSCFCLFLNIIQVTELYMKNVIGSATYVFFCSFSFFLGKILPPSLEDITIHKKL